MSDARTEAPPVAAVSQRRGGARKAFYYFHGCFLRRTDGCHVRTIQTLDMLRASGLDIVVYSYANHDQWPWREEDKAAFARLYPEVRLVLEQHDWRLTMAQRARTLLSMMGRGLRRWALRTPIAGLSPELDALRKQGPFDLAFINGAAGLPAINGVPGAQWCVDTQDLTSLEHFQRPPFGALRLESLFELHKEMSLLAAADLVWSISHAEYWVLNQLIDPTRVRLVPPTGARGAAPARHPMDGEIDHDLVFVGSDNRWNAIALIGFLNDFAKWRGQRTLGIAGSVCRNPDVIERVRTMPNVKLLGFVSDLDRFYQRARASICPVAGTGTKIKLVEALLAGMPVFAPPASCVGLVPGFENSVFDLDEAHVEALLSDPASYQKALREAQTYAHHYAFDVVLEAERADLVSPL